MKAYLLTYLLTCLLTYKLVDVIRYFYCHKGWQTKTKKAPSPYKVSQLDTNPVFQYLGESLSKYSRIIIKISSEYSQIPLLLK